MSSSFLTVMPAVATITEFLRTADESGRAMVIGILQQTISAAGGDVSVAPMALSIKAPSSSASAGGKTPKAAKTPRVLSEETKAAKTAFMAGLVAEVKAVQTELSCTYKEAQTEVAIRKIEKEQGKSREEAEAIYAARNAEKAAKKEAKASGLPTPRAARTPKAEGAAKTPKAKKAKAPAADEAATGGAESPASVASAAALSIRAPAEAVEVTEVKPKVKKAKKAAEPEADLKAQFAENDLDEVEIQGKTYYMNTKSLEVYAYAGKFKLGGIVGTFDEDTEEIIPVEADSDDE